MNLLTLTLEEMQMPGNGSVDMRQAGGSFAAISPAMESSTISAPTVGAGQEQENSIA